MVREPDATMQPAPQDNQLMSKHRVLGFKPQLRLEWRGQDGQNETEQPDHSASLGDSITSSTRIRFSVHTPSGPIHDAVLRQINVGARIAICGTASYASWDPWNEGPRPERHLLVKRAIMQGFLTTDFAPRYEEAVAALAGWVREGKLKYREDMQEGIEAAPASIAMLYAGENHGKLVIKL